MGWGRNSLTADELKIGLDLLHRSKIAIGHYSMPEIAFTHGFFYSV